MATKRTQPSARLISHNENWRDDFKKVETVGAETVEGKDCYKLVKTPNDGNPVTDYFDKKTGLLVKSATTVNTPNGDMTAEVLFSDYRKEGDLLVAHKIQQSAAGQEIAITFEGFKYNVDLPKDKFDLPDDIKTLLKKLLWPVHFGVRMRERLRILREALLLPLARRWRGAPGRGSAEMAR